ncbi:MAG: hypothetical protein P9M03_07865, partial [Candidatus Theseobacter exili]|nr:hypothetical protein [Candidatus Theseobacter exili]
MNNKTDGLLYFRKILQYSGYKLDRKLSFKTSARYNDFSEAGASDIRAASCSKTGTIINGRENFKMNIYGSFGITDTGFFNALGGAAGVERMKSIHLGRTFNRAIDSDGIDCFFLTGNMGSSNGSVTPKIPTAYAPSELGRAAKGDVFTVEILNTGAVGVAKFRYRKYPFFQNRANVVGARSNAYGFSTVFTAYSETIPIVYSGTENEAYVRGETLCVSTIEDVSCIESRLLDNVDDTVNLKLNALGNKILFYTEPTFMELDREINLTLSGSELNLYMITYADGYVYGIGDGDVYKINITTGVATEIASASMTGTDQFILASHLGDKVFCIVDGNVKVIKTSDCSVTTPVHSLPDTPDKKKVLSTSGIDYESNFWYKGSKYDKDTFEELVRLTTTIEGATVYGLYSVAIHTNAYVRNYDLDGNLIRSYLGNDYNWGVNPPAYKTVFGIYCYHSAPIYVNLDASENDSRKISLEYSQDIKDWRVYTGSAWVKGWFKGRPTGFTTDKMRYKCLTYPTVIPKDSTYYDYLSEIDVLAGAHRVEGEVIAQGTTSIAPSVTIRFEHISSSETFDIQITGVRYEWTLAGGQLNLPYDGKYKVSVKNSNGNSTYV